MSTVVQEKRVVYHAGDLVTIVNPEVFVRVGYPLTKNDALKAAEQEYGDRIYAFMREVSPTPDQFTIYNADARLCSDLVDALASYWIRCKGFGGKERKIYTETNEALRNTKGWRVLSKRTVKTGTYNRGGWFGGYDGGDYEPPYLDYEKCHVLLMLECAESNASLDWARVVEIEAVNVTPDC